MPTGGQLYLQHHAANVVDVGKLLVREGLADALAIEPLQHLACCRKGLQAAVSRESCCRVLYPHSVVSKHLQALVVSMHLQARVVSIHLQARTKHLAVGAHKRRADLHEPLQQSQATTLYTFTAVTHVHRWLRRQAMEDTAR